MPEADQRDGTDDPVEYCMYVHVVGRVGTLSWKYLGYVEENWTDLKSWNHATPVRVHQPKIMII